MKYLLFLNLFIPLFLFAQKEGLTTTFPVLDNFPSGTTIKGAYIKDKEGNLKLQTDGYSLYNANGEIIYDAYKNNFAAEIYGFIPIEESQGRYYYYVFEKFIGSLLGETDLFYTVVDTKRNKILFDPICLDTAISRSFTMVKHQNGIDTWLIYMDRKNESFESILFSACGVGNAIKSFIGFNQRLGGWSTAWSTSADLFIASPNGKRLLYACEADTIIKIKGIPYYDAQYPVFNFENNSGKIKHYATYSYITQGTTTYGLFSSNGDYLYGCNMGDYYTTSYFNQLDFRDSTNIVVKSIPSPESINPVSHDGFYYGEGGKIYQYNLLRKIDPYEPSVMINHVIEYPNKPADSCNYHTIKLNPALSIGNFGAYRQIMSFYDPNYHSPEFGIGMPQLPTFNACASLPLKLYPKTPIGGDSATWELGNGTKFQQDSLHLNDTLTYSYADTGTYKVRLIRHFKCINDTAEVDLKVRPRPNITLSPDTAYYCEGGESRSIVASSVEGTSFSWSNGTLGEHLNTSDTGTYIVTAKSSCGIVKDTAFVLSLKQFIPNVITPNGDGLNDQFVIKSNETPLGKLQVYNRWGATVYHSENYDNRWTGEGTGVYYYSYENLGCKVKGWLEVR